jgi:GDP-L-fucose synthase
LADACFFLMQHYEGEWALNVGTGEDISIAELAELIKNIAGYKGKLSYDKSKPDGTPRKLLDVSRIHSLGWKHRISLEEGIRSVWNNAPAEMARFVSHA